MALATLSIDLVAKLGELQSGMDKAGRIAEKSAAQIEARFAAVRGAALGIGTALAGALSLTAFKQFFSTTVNGLDALNDLADATGSSIENLSALEDAAARTGTSMETVGTAVIKLNKALGDAKPGSPQAAALRAIGLEAEALKQLDPSEALLQVAIALNGYADDANKARLVQELFGKSLKDVAPLLNDLAKAGKLNATVTAQQAAEAEKFNQQIDRLSKNVNDAARAIVGDMLPALNKLLETYASLKKNGGFFESIGTEIKANLASDRLRVVVADIEAIQQTINRQGGDGYLVKRLAALREEAAMLSKQAFETSDQLKKFADKVDGRTDTTNFGNEGRNTPKPSVGADQGADPKARQAQLDALLANFQRQFGLTAAAISAGEQVLQANRGANLLEDKAYYTAKRALLKADEAAQVTVLQNELAALADYRSKVGSAIPEEQQIGIQRQIADKAAKISEIRIKAGAALAVLNVNERRDLEQVSIAFEKAQASAEVYLGKLFEAQQQELQGQGQGDAQRRRTDGALAIERDYKSQIETLDQQRIAGRFDNDRAAYDRELQLIEQTRAKAVELYNDYYTQLEAKQADASLGAQRAIENYLASAKDVAAQTEQAYTNAFKGLEDSLVEFAQTGKLSFKSLADSIIADLIRIEIRAALVKLIGGTSGNSAGGNSGSLIGSLIGAVFGGARAMGGPVNAGSAYLVGERGPEIIVPRNAGYVVPNSALASGRSMPGNSAQAGAQINYSPVFNISGAPADLRTQQQIAAAAARGLQVAAARNN